MIGRVDMIEGVDSVKLCVGKASVEAGGGNAVKGRGVASELAAVELTALDMGNAVMAVADAERVSQLSEFLSPLVETRTRENESTGAS